MAVGVWAGQASSGGLSVAENKACRIAVMQDGARRGHATRVKRSHKAPHGHQGEKEPQGPEGCCCPVSLNGDGMNPG